MAGTNVSLYARTAEFIRDAVAADAQGQHGDALAHYNSALKSIIELRAECAAQQQRAALDAKYVEYVGRAGALLRQLAEDARHHGELDRAQAALHEARSQHAGGNIGAALSLYAGAIGRYQKILRAECAGGAPAAAAARGWSRELHRFAAVCLKEAEWAKAAAVTEQRRATPAATPRLVVASGPDLQHKLSELSLGPGVGTRTPDAGAALAAAVVPARRGSSRSMRSSSSSSHSHDAEAHGLVAGSGDVADERLTAAEAEVVRTTSHINGLTFLPWVDGDSTERFDVGAAFTDKDGLLRLSAKQQRKLARWQRASQLYARPAVFGQRGCAHIVQETVTDCSFVAALCVCLEHELRFGRPLITQHMFPRGAGGRPAFNPAGKYMVRLFVNGLWRRVVIDDLLPVAESGRLLCTYSTAGDIGQSLMEKAFLKVMGGYDFPGSNSSTDLHVLTGWIPEHVFVQDQAFDAEQTWARMHAGLRDGDVLLTIATGEMSADVAAALGLVPSHAYAVLDVREACGHRLLMVKNPWSSLRWTGRFSPADRAGWSPELMQLLGYDPAAAERDDRGVFWIDYESVCHRFDAIHLNWRPAMFAHRASAHFCWALDVGPRQALYDFSENPQYTLTVTGPASAQHSNQQQQQQPVRVWILLSKHVTKTEENRDFIALHVYDGRGGRRVCEPRAAMHIGEYVNTQHALVRFEAAPGARYTVVVAQREKTRALCFTLRAMSATAAAAVRLDEAAAAAFREEVAGQWGSASAGGNTASPRYLDNPQYQLTVHGAPGARCSGTLTLEAAQKHPVNLRVFRGGFLVTRVLEINTVASSGKYRTQFCACDLDAVEAGASYTVVASTFEPFMFSRFALRVGLDCPFTIAPIAREGAGMRLRELHGRWAPGTASSGGPVDQGCARSPRFLVRTDRPTTVLARLQTPRAAAPPLINVSVFAFDDAVLGRACASSGSYTNSPQGVATRLAPIAGPAEFLVVASTWDHDADAEFVLYFYSEHAVDVTPLAVG
ncbi:cysteine protease [Coemansia javaensis]|uniref:Cysteine protease n=1 Tax=Coemansia javaensis TaxID=2761396 RepID=A0A9W8LKC8_9FUNG|nr:cysteine protease [Coemansia javaensis]